MFGLDQMIDEPTRISINKSSLLDHILTNFKDIICQQGVIRIGLSDHDIIFCTRKIKRPKSYSHNTIYSRSFKNYTKENFIEKLNKIKFPDYSLFNCVDKAYESFIRLLSNAINEIAPMIEKRIKGNSKAWFGNEIIQSINTREKLKQVFDKSKLQVDYEKFKKQRNLVQSLIKYKKSNYIKDKLNDNIKNPKELWKTLKSLGIPTKSSKQSKLSLYDNDCISFDDYDNANIFKKSFSEVAPNLLKKLPTARKEFGIESTQNYYSSLNIIKDSFGFSLASSDDIYKIITKINPNKACGIDNLSGRFLIDGAEVLANPICQITNLSLASRFPKECKMAKVKPLYKKGSRTDPLNYRPISLLPLLSKVIERIVLDQLNIYLETNDILFKYQSGFRSRHSVNTCLSHLSNKVLTGFDSGKSTGMVLIDLQKAFDTLDHEILLGKLKILGLRKEAIEWFKSYLTNRNFKINLANSYSDLGTSDYGVPQGSILGPTLFLLYVNDMKSALQHCDLSLYADDTCILYSHHDVNNIEFCLNNDFNKLCQWFNDNKLSIHFGEEKTKSILFTNKTKGSLNIVKGEKQIKQFSSVEYLGCILDEKMTGEPMALKAMKKINGKINFLFRQNKFLSYSLKRMLCNALIQPHFDFACCCWYTTLSKSLKDKLQSSQNRCIRYCLGLGKRSHVGLNEFKKINWLPVEKRVDQCIAVTAYNHYNNLSPSYMNDVYKINDTPAIRTRRSLKSFKQPQYLRNKSRKALSYIGSKTWNDLFQKTKSSVNTVSLKHCLKQTFFKEEV